VSLTAGALIGILAFSAPPQDDKSLQPAIKKFREEYFKAGAKDDDRIQAINYLAQYRCDRIVGEFSPLLTEASMPVRIITARLLGNFTCAEKAPAVLLGGLKSQANSGKKNVPVRIEILRALGALRYKPAAADIAKLVEDKEVWVAKAAIDACGRIRFAEAVDPLLKSLRRIEGVAGEVEVNPLDDLIEGVGRGDLFKSDSRQKRPTEREVLKQPILSALNSVTKESFQSSKDWDSWWSKNKASFRVAD
jgi:HEAT repeat protein